MTFETCMSDGGICEVVEMRDSCTTASRKMRMAGLTNRACSQHPVPVQ
jgi:hypothetical protein